MAIASAIQKGPFVYIYNEQRLLTATLPAGDGLHGFTSAIVSIRRGTIICLYNEKGQLTGTLPAG